MSRLVIGSSVLVKWWVPEVYAADALRYLDPDTERDSPDPLLAETSNILCKEVRAGELSREEAERIGTDLVLADVTIHPMAALLGAAPRLGLETGRSMYDSMYLALAETLSNAVVTADRRLDNAPRGGLYAGLVLWVEDGP